MCKLIYFITYKLKPVLKFKSKFTCLVFHLHYKSNFMSTELPPSESIDMPDLVWRVLSVSAGAYGSHQLTGISKIVKTVITPLADFKVSVLVISTYQSDYVLVRFGGIMFIYVK